MPVVTLTDVSLRSLRPVPGKQVTYIDRSLKGFGVRVSETGAKSYVLTHGYDRHRVKLGDVGIVALKDARIEAKRILAEQTLGKHRPQSISWDEALKLFLSLCEQKNKPRTVRDYKRLLNRHFRFGNKQLSEIAPQDINRKIDRLQKTVSEQNHALVALKVFMRWAQRRHYIDHPPSEGMQTVKRPSRDRILLDAEIVAVYRTAEKIGHPFGTIVQLCILCGLRRTEVAWLRRCYVKDGVLTLPAPLMKNKHELVLPVGRLAQSVIAAIPGDDDRLFPAQRGDQVFGGWSKQKDVLDKKIAEAGCKVAPFVLHDLRRFFATKHAEIGTPIHLTERLLGHISGSTTGGLIAVYQRHSFMPEMAQALRNYEAHLAKLFEQP